MHEIAHRFFCDLTKVPVYKVSYFDFESFGGYVIHGEAKGLGKNFLISIGPLIVNTILCALFMFPAVFPFLILYDKSIGSVTLLLAWLGLSIGMHAFPSNHDMQSYFEAVREGKGISPLYFIALLFAVITKIANLLRIIWFDAIYAFSIGILLPMMLVG